MKNKMIGITRIIIEGIFLISLVSSAYPGECYEVKFPNKLDVNLTITENTSSLDGFTWTKEGYIITYCFPSDFTPCS